MSALELCVPQMICFKLIEAEMKCLRLKQSLALCAALRVRLCRGKAAEAAADGAP